MASCSKRCWLALALLGLAVLASAAAQGLSAGYYDRTCPNVQNVVRSVMARRVAGEPRMAPAILRLFFHDCFINGCDASVLLDATPFSASEKDATPNAGSLTGFDVVDEIKSVLEHDCPATVSCADVLALASRDAVAMLGGPAWAVQLGRKDSRGVGDAETGLPSQTDSLDELRRMFGKYGLDGRDLTALSGAHTVGRAHGCDHYKDRIYGEGADIDPTFAALLRQSCQQSGGQAVAPFDGKTPTRFDNAYYQDLIERRGLLTSDQELYGHGGLQDNLVEMYARDGEAFARDFAKAMVKLGNIPAPQGMQVEVRLNCKMVNN